MKEISKGKLLIKFKLWLIGKLWTSLLKPNCSISFWLKLPNQRMYVNGSLIKGWVNIYFDKQGDSDESISIG